MEGKRLRRILHKATRATVVVATVALGVQVLLRNSHEDVKPLGALEDEAVAAGSSPVTVWELIRNDTRVSTFANILGEFKDIVGGLNAPKAKFTVYVPTNEAFEKETFAWDLPSFYWLYVVGYHMGPGAFSKEDLSKMNTAPSFIFADIFQNYRQRISTQIEGGSFSFNHKAKYVTPDIAGVNGYVHHIDRVLMLPESTSDLLREDPDFSTFRKGLVQTDVAVVVNDTSTHVGQTVFAPSNTAFKKLGSKVIRFLFSPYGKPYLRALLEYHIVANRTMFTDTYFQANGQGQIPLTEGSTLDLPTLLPKHNLSISIDMDGSRSVPKINEVRIAQADIVVMDGVVHKMDNILLPPKRAQEEVESHQDSWLDSLLRWTAGYSGLDIEELMERLQPFSDDSVL